jgi:hypothetical protein
MVKATVNIGWYKEIRNPESVRRGDEPKAYDPMIYHHLMRVLDDGSQAPWSASEQAFVLEQPKHARLPRAVDGSPAKYEPCYGQRSLGFWLELAWAGHALLDAVLDEVIHDAKLLSAAMAATEAQLRHPGTK